MTAGSQLLRSEQADAIDRIAQAPETALPQPAADSLAAGGLRARIRARLLYARALERVPPETYGFSVATATWLFCVTAIAYRRYFRTQCFGIDRLPAGPFLLVANHGSHVLSWDGANIVSACLLDADPPRLVHGMAEHRLMELPILGRAARRIGAVDGRRAACIDLLRAGAAVLAFPEGTRGLARPYRQRYQLARFGEGFVHVAMETGAPIVPVAVIGSEEEAPLLANPQWLRRLVRTPVAPITPTIVFPLPVRYRLHFGDPLRVDGPATPERVLAGVEHVRHALAGLIDHGLAARRHVFV
jgi:1-acyl-sn-glycerol-3-phosphate acyltransferase